MNYIKSIYKDITILKINQNNKNRATISVTNNVEIMEALEVDVVVESVVVAVFNNKLKN